MSDGNWLGNWITNTLFGAAQRSSAPGPTQNRGRVGHEMGLRDQQRRSNVAEQRTNMRNAASGRQPISLRDAALGVTIPGGAAYGAVLGNRQVLVQPGAAGSGALGGGSVNFAGQQLFPMKRGNDVIWVPRGGSGPTEIENRYGIPVGRGNGNGGGGGGGGGGGNGGGWTPVVTPGSRARLERMNELSQQAGGQNYTYGTGFPKEFEAAKSAAPVVEQYRKDLAANPLADTPELIDQRSQAYTQRADIAKWLETMQGGSASDRAIAERFLAKQRLPGPSEERMVTEAVFGGERFDPYAVQKLESLGAEGRWARDAMTGLKDSKFDAPAMEFGGTKLDPYAIESIGALGAGADWASSGMAGLKDFAPVGAAAPGGLGSAQEMPINPATAETNRQINFEGSPIPAANAAQAEKSAGSEFLEKYMRLKTLR